MMVRHGRRTFDRVQRVGTMRLVQIPSPAGEGDQTCRPHFKSPTHALAKTLYFFGRPRHHLDALHRAR